MGIEEQYNSIAKRQRIIHYVFTICLDYSHVLGYVTGQKAVVGLFSADNITLYKSDDGEVLCTINLPGIYAWLDEFERNSDVLTLRWGRWIP